MSATNRDVSLASRNGSVPDDRVRNMVGSIVDVAEDIECRLALDERQLDDLRRATRRLRRAIEVHTIAASLPCRGCGEIFVQVDPAEQVCSEACEAAGAAGPEGASAAG
jgi:hypothetical protein